MSNRRAPHDQIRVSQLQVLRICTVKSKDTDSVYYNPNPKPKTIYVVCRNGDSLFGYLLNVKERLYSFGALVYYKWHSACWWPQDLLLDEKINIFLDQMCGQEADCHHVRMDAILTLLNLEC